VIDAVLLGVCVGLGVGVCVADAVMLAVCDGVGVTVLLGLPTSFMHWPFHAAHVQFASAGTCCGVLVGQYWPTLMT